MFRVLFVFFSVIAFVAGLLSLGLFLSRVLFFFRRSLPVFAIFTYYLRIYYFTNQFSGPRLPASCRLAPLPNSGNVWRIRVNGSATNIYCQAAAVLPTNLRQGAKNSWELNV